MNRRHGGGKGGFEPRARICAREERVVVQSIEGRSQMEIAEREGISQAAVSKILRRVNTRVLAQITEHAKIEKARQLRVLDHLSQEGRREWHASKKGRIKKRQRRHADGTVSQDVVVHESPDPRFLEQTRKAEEAKARLLGLDTKPKPEHGPPDTPLQMTDEDLVALLNRIAESLARKNREPFSTATETSERAAPAGSACGSGGDKKEENAD